MNNASVTDVRTEGNQALVTLADHSVHTADVVLGMDGLHSTLRAKLHDDRPIGSGYVAFRGTVPMAESALEEELEDVVGYIGPHCHFIQHPLRGGTLLNQVAVFQSPAFLRGEEKWGDVVLEQRSIDAHKAALRQSSGTPAGPDIYWYWEGPGLGGSLVDKGVSRDLTEYYDKYDWKNRFTPGSMANITRYGGYHGVPWTLQGESIFYNKDLFAEAGITAVPQTYDELVDAADKLVAAGITPYAVGGTVNWHVMRLLDSLLEKSCGSQTNDALTSFQASWADEPCVTEAFTDLKTWGDKYLNKGFMGIDRNESNQLFYTGKAAMMYEGGWGDANVRDNGMNPDAVGLFPFPTGTGRMYGFGEGFYVSALSEHPDEAAAFLDYATSAPVQADAVVGAWSAISVNKDVSPAVKTSLNKQWPPIFASATGLYMNNDQNFPLDRTTEYWRIQDSVLTGLISPADAGADFQKFIDAGRQ